MSVTDRGKSPDSLPPAGKHKRRFLSPEKKYQIFLEAQRGEAPVGDLLRREGLYSTDLARIQRKVKEGALQHLAQRPGRNKKTVSEEEYDRLKRELQEKERVMAEMAVELGSFEKKRMGVRGKDRRPLDG